MHKSSVSSGLAVRARFVRALFVAGLAAAGAAAAAHAQRPTNNVPAGPVGRIVGRHKTRDNRMRRIRGWIYSLLALASSATPYFSLHAQDTTRTRPDTTKPVVDTQPAAPRPALAPALPFDFSGIL